MLQKRFLITVMITLMYSVVCSKPVIVDLAIGESFVYELKNGIKKRITVLSVNETRDVFRHAIRKAEVGLDVDGKKVIITASLYNLPRIINGVKLDVAVTKGYIEQSSKNNVWNLKQGKDVRLRFWDPDQPYLEPESFLYPIKQRWSASDTQMANDPCYVDNGEDPRQKDIYYHYGLDFGGYDLLVPIVAATDGEVVSTGDKILPEIIESNNQLFEPRYDVINIRDKRGWYYRYAHLSSILPHIQPGVHVKMGEQIGILGKEGESGGWSHLHFHINGSEGSEKGLINAYPFIVEAYLKSHPGALLAVARPHHLVRAGDSIELNGLKSICDQGTITSFQWTFHDGTQSGKPVVKKTYPKAGVYSEILRVKDNRGQEDTDFAVVHVLDGEKTLNLLPPSIHATYYPTENLKPNDEIYMKVRTFRVRGGKETWNFDDGSTGETCSMNDYATISHHYDKPGMYIVTIKRDSNNGTSAMTHLKIIIEE